jgi:hypothetical protein
LPDPVPRAVEALLHCTSGLFDFVVGGWVTPHIGEWYAPAAPTAKRAVPVKGNCMNEPNLLGRWCPSGSLAETAYGVLQTCRPGLISSAG